MPARPKSVVTSPPAPKMPESPGLKALVDLTHDTERDWASVAGRAIAFRMAGMSMQQIADELLVSVGTVRKWLTEARKNAALLDVTPLLDHVALPQAVDNLIAGLEAGNEKYTLATLQGRGAFSAHSKQETHATSMALEIHVEMPPTSRVADAVEGHIVGQPRVITEARDA